MHCHRNVFRRSLSIFVIVFAVLLGTNITGAEEGSNSSKSLKQILIDNYLQAAFSRGDQLIRPVGVPRIAYYCPGDFCNSVLMRLKSDFPSFVSQTEVTTESSDAEILVLFYPSVDKLEKSRPRYRAPPGANLEFLNSGECRLGRYTVGSAVVKIIAAVVVQDNKRASEACVLVEVMRGSGLEFRDMFDLYSKYIMKMTDAEFERNVVMETVNFIKIHWQAPTEPGMTSSIVKKNLGRFRHCSSKNSSLGEIVMGDKVLATGPFGAIGGGHSADPNSGVVTGVGVWAQTSIGPASVQVQAGSTKPQTAGSNYPGFEISAAAGVGPISAGPITVTDYGDSAFNFCGGEVTESAAIGALPLDLLPDAKRDTYDKPSPGYCKLMLVACFDAHGVAVHSST